MISSTESPKTQDLKAKILVGTPAYGGQCFIGYVSSLMTSKEYLRTKGIQLETCWLTNESLITRGRNSILAKFMNDPSFTHLLFIDADVSWNHRSIERLVNHDKDLVGALYPKKGYSWDKLMKAKDLIKEPFDLKAQQEVKSKLMNYVVNYSNDRKVVNGLLKVKHIGTGFFLAKRTMILKMMEHYPELKYDDDINILSESENKWLYALFDCEVHRLGPKLHYLSEDYLFCKRWQDMGGDIYADVTIPLTHTGTHSFVGNFLKSINFEPSRPTMTTTGIPSVGVSGSDMKGVVPPTPTPTSTPTSTPVPTPTPVPTSTPVPTPTPVPTSTPVPTPTPVPTSTSVPAPAPVSPASTLAPVPAPALVTATPAVVPRKRLSPGEIGKMTIQ